MKFSTLTVSVLCLAMAFTACSKSSDDEEKSSKKDIPSVPIAKDADGNPITGIRYYNQDSVMKAYNLAKDYEETTLRLQRTLESTMQARQNAIDKFAMSIQTKMNGGQYASEAAAKQDYDKWQTMQTNAQAEIGKLQESTMRQISNMKMEVLDSLSSVLKDIGHANGLEAILIASPDQYFAPALDVTDIIIEELNKRYTKVATKE